MKGHRSNLKEQKMKSKRQESSEIAKELEDLDNELSNRFIALDKNGYFLIKLNLSLMEIVAEHYSNDIDELGRAIDPETGKPLSCKGQLSREPIKVYKGRTAKQLGIALTEGEGPHPITQLDHALYIGRELQRAESCLLSKTKYIQD